LLFGGGLYCAARGIGIFLETQQLPAVAGAVLIADLVGLLAIIVPGGIGVREGGIYFFLLPVLGPANAILFPIVTRFLYVVNDLALGAVSAFCIRFFSTKEAGNQSTNNSEMPILLVLSSGYPKAPGDVRGGAPFAHELAKRLTDCFEVHVLTPFCEGTSSFQEMDGVRINRFKYLPKNVRDLTGEGGIADNLRSSPLNYLKVPPLFFFLGLALLAFLWKNRRRSVVVHAHWLIPQGVVAAIVVKLFRKQTRLLCTAHGSDVMGFKAGPIKRLLTYTLKSSDNVSAVSSALGEAISSELAFTGAHIAPMGIDTAEFHPSRKSTELRRLYGATGPLVLFVGFLVDVKGVDTLLRAFASILPDHPTARLVLVGEGQERFHLESLAKELSISEQTIFAGAMPHSAIAPLMATADLFVGPSLREGFGLVFAEAMSSECVVLASAIPPLQHLIYPGQTGLLAEAANPQSFAMQMDEVMKAPESFEAIRKAARIRIVESFDWEAVARRYRAILQDLIVPRPKPR
jgi:glycosyltransferase involved in cell wall biosynthesis